MLHEDINLSMIGAVRDGVIGDFELIGIERDRPQTSVGLGTERQPSAARSQALTESTWAGGFEIHFGRITASLRTSNLWATS